VKTVEEKMKIFDDLYSQACELLAQYNPCKVTNGECCRKVFCCYGCDYLGPKGCKVEALLCRIWLCESAKRNVDTSFIAKMLNIYNIGKKHGLLVARGSRKDVFDLISWDAEEYSRNVCDSRFALVHFEFPWGKTYKIVAVVNNL
jgi:hypothetical protein